MLMALKPYWWRSSNLSEIDRHCLAVIHPNNAGMVDRKIFGAGTVSHDVYSRVQVATNKAGQELEHLEVEKIACGAIKRGAAEGRVFEGAVEPPLRPQAYLDGKELAVRWLAERPAQPGRETELAITIDQWGVIVGKDDPQRWMRGIVDLMWINGDRVLVIPDLKTDWPSEAGALHSTQRKIQMLLGFAWATSNDERIAGIRPEVWNLRRNKIYPHEEDRDQYTLDVESMGLLEEWREDLLALTGGYETAMSKRSSKGQMGPTAEELASPGAGCTAGEGGCPALAKCKAGQDWVAKRGAGDVEAAAVQQPVLWAESARLRGILEPAANALGTLEVGGMKCGFESKPGFEPRRDAVLELWREFRGDQISQTVDCLCQGMEPECQMCSGLGKSIDWERELTRQRSLIVTFLRAIPIGHTTFAKDILPKLWPLVRVPKEDRVLNKVTRGLLSERLLEPINRPKWFCRKKPEPVEPGDTLLQTLEKSIEQGKESA